jgi:uncharacterized protein YdiU (UPF0061 family)
MDIKAGWRLEHTYADLPQLFYSSALPTPVREPRLVAFNRPLATVLGLDPDMLQGPEGAAIFAGNALPDGARPIAQAYAGHQFGHPTVLGDGRAILLGEQVTPSGNRVDIQLKGAGRTRFSRRGDGRAALGPMLREYIISEVAAGPRFVADMYARLPRQPDWRHGTRDVASASERPTARERPSRSVTTSIP